MHQRKKLWKGKGGSVGVLVYFMFQCFFFLLIFFHISTETNLQVIIIFFLQVGSEGRMRRAKDRMSWAQFRLK